MNSQSTPPPISVVTGGASGIGASIVDLLIKRGHFVFIADRNKENGAALQDRYGDRVEFFPMDVTSEESFVYLGKKITQMEGQLYSFVNNAGIGGAMGPISQLKLSDYELANDVLYKSVFLGTRLAAQLMTPNGQGRIVNIGSIAGLSLGHSPHLYAGAKSAVIHFSQSVAVELAESGIQLNVVCPGVIKTPIITGTTDETWKERADRIAADMKDYQPLPRIGEPEEIAAATVWLICDAPDFLVGHPLVVDGGTIVGKPWRLQPDHFRNYHP